MSTIMVLDTNTANKIAAGEVVERPASIVKELCENAIDAGSSHIEIEIAEGGTSFIRVTDDGIGMSREDAQKAILRHATSKIRQAEDLTTLSTLGFRGEALPSIAAVTRFTLTTRQVDDELATFIDIVGGEVQDVRDAGANVGTTIIAKDLFFNTPARRKFLKTASSETSHIHDIVDKLALSHPAIGFKLINNNKLLVATNGNGNMLETLVSIYGQRIEPELLPVSLQQDGIEICGYISKPTLLKSSRQWQTYIVNERVIQSKAMMKALDNAYKALVPKTGHPLALLLFNVDSHSIDINVHPQKLEIKFSDEQRIFRAVYKAVLNALSAAHRPGELAATQYPAPLYNGSTNGATSAPQYKSHIQSACISQSQSAQHPYSVPLGLGFTSVKPEKAAVSFSEAQDLINGRDEIRPLVLQETHVQTETADEGLYLQPLGQFGNLFIIAQGADGLYIIDQHAAHERILYDKFCHYVDRMPSQQLLLPLYLELGSQEIDIIAARHKAFYDLGFNTDVVGPDTVRVVEMPADVAEKDARDLLLEILQLLQELKDPEPAELRSAGLKMAACRAAIKAGQSLNMRQMQALIEELCATDFPFTCPHGRPAMVRFTLDGLEKMFKRT